MEVAKINGYTVKDAKAREAAEKAIKDIVVERARINALVANTGESTEGNAELIDIRITHKGRSFATAGEAVRNADAEIDGKVTPIWAAGQETQIAHTSVETGRYQLGDGSIGELEWTNVYTVPVEPNTTYICKQAYNGLNNCWLAFYDESGAFIYGVKNTDPDAESYTKDIVACAPGNAAVMKYTTNPDNAHGVFTYYPWDVGKLFSDMQNLNKTFWATGKKVKMTPANTENDKYVTGDGSIGELSGYSVHTFNVSENTYYEIENASTGSPNWYVAFYDSYGNLLGGKRHSTEIGYYFSGTVLAPETAVTMKVQQGGGEAVAYQRVMSVGSMAGKKWAAFGDSITEKNIRATSVYCDYIAEATGIEAHNLGISGTGYAYSRSTSGNAFHHRTGEIPADCDVVTIFGGGNDIALTDLPLGNDTDTGTETLCGCFNTTINNIFAAHPLIKLGIITPCPWERFPLTEPGNEMELFVDAMIRICRTRGIPVLDLYRCSGLRPWDATFRAAAYTRDDGDGTHPDENGHKFIASHIKAFLETLVI